MFRDKGRGHFTLEQPARSRSHGRTGNTVRSGVINKGQAQTPCWVLKGSSIRGGPQAQEKAFRGLKQDLPGGENTECSSFSGCGNARLLLWTASFYCQFPTDVALWDWQRCDWSYLPRHTLGWLGAGKIQTLNRKGGEGKAPFVPTPPAHHPLHVTLPAVSPFMQMLLINKSNMY